MRTLKSLSSRKACMQVKLFQVLCFLSIITGFLCSQLHHYPLIGFFGYYSFVIIHFLLSIYYYSCFSTASTRSYIYIYIYETKLKIMQLNLYLTPISQGTYGTKELQFECKHTHMVKSSLIQIIYVAMKVLHGALFNFILFYLVMI